MRIIRLVALVLSTTLCLTWILDTSAQEVADSPQGFDVRILDGALRTSSKNGDITIVVNEMRRIFAGSNECAIEEAVRWIYDKRESQTLTSKEAEEIWKVYIEAFPEKRELVLETIYREQLGSASREVRSALYWQAIREGEASYEGKVKLTRADAISSAAYNGLDEFKPMIEKYSDELDRQPNQGRGNSNCIRWVMRLRSGAIDGRDAINRHISNLLAMEDSRFYELMETDRAFEKVNSRLFESTCVPEFGVRENGSTIHISLPCQDLSKLGKRQAMFWEKKVQKDPSWVEETIIGQRFGPGWLNQLYEATKFAGPILEKRLREERNRGAK